MNNPEKLAMRTPSLADTNFAALAALFPNAVTETVDENGAVVRAIDKDVLAQEINAHVVEGREERHQFTWPDKRKSILLANAPIAAALRPCREESVNFDTTENLYIEGDNLDVLKLLRETYLGRVDVIYIDPPYNTGTSFIYYNDFFQNASDYISNSGQYDENGNCLMQNTESNGRFHTDWLNMIYPRLRAAKDLLKDTGILVLTIDDYEINTVTTILNEIFSEENHLGTVVIKNNPSGRSTVKGFSVNHEYALFYSKSNSASLGMMKHNDEQISRYNEKDDIGFFEWENFRKNGTDSDRRDRPKQFYPIVINEDTSQLRIPKTRWSDDEKEYTILDNIGQNEKILLPVTPAGTEKVWKYGIERANSIIDEMLVKKTIQGYELYRKKYLNESGSLPRTWWDKPEYSARDNGTRILTNIFGPDKMFDFPKAPEAVKDALIAANLQADGLAMDFFSGSATTAHAIMQLNAEDCGKRKFIMVQLPEEVDEKSGAYKAGYRNICEIGKERIRRAGQKIKDEAGFAAQGLDVGFRVLKLDSTNMKDVYYTPDEYMQMGLSFDGLADNIKEDRSPEDLLFQVMLDLGIPLSAKIEQRGNVFYVNDNYLIASFKRVDTILITEIAKQKPYYAVFRDSSFASDSSLVNFEQVFNTYSPNTIRRVL
ncbi:site-specific DNA-methyltransferase [Clostridia bacterium]|nr:site-specific DNA-methyltransferase [Clostridia bacterium]